MKILKESFNSLLYLILLDDRCILRKIPTLFSNVLSLIIAYFWYIIVIWESYLLSGMCNTLTTNKIFKEAITKMKSNMIKFCRFFLCLIISIVVTMSSISIIPLNLCQADTLKVNTVLAGDSNTVVLKSDGTVWERAYYLGSGTSTLMQVLDPYDCALTDIIAVSETFDNRVALKKDGTVWAWRRYDSTIPDRRPREAINGSNIIKAEQVNVSNGNVLTDIIAVAAGGEHAIALKEDGTVWAWGVYTSGKLDNDTNIGEDTAVEVRNLNGSELKDIVAVSAGNEYTVAVKDDGTVWTWGYNNFGQLGDGSTINSSTPVQVKDSLGNPLTGIITISAGYNHTVAIKSDDTIWAWGRNNFGQLGDGTYEDKNTAVEAKNLNGNAVTGITSISAGPSDTVAIKNDDTILTWGFNDFDQFSNEASLNNVPLRIFTIRDTKPSNGDIDVSPDTSITVNFDEAINRGNEFSNISVKDTNGNTVNIVGDINGSTLKLTPQVNLFNNTKYIVTIPKNAITDSISTPYDGGSFSFTTGNLNIITAPRIGFKPTSYTINENEGSISLTVAIEGTIIEATTVDYTTSDGNAVAGKDYTAVNGTLLFTDRETSKTITIPLIDEGVYDKGIKVFTVILNNPSSGSITTGSATVIINNNNFSSY